MAHMAHMAQWVEQVQGANENTVVVLPLGALEQHGPHLPLETDTVIAQGVCARLMARLAHLSEQKNALDYRILPVQDKGYSREHMDYQGSQTLLFDEAIRGWVEIGTRAYHGGARRFVLRLFKI